MEDLVILYFDSKAFVGFTMDLRRTLEVEQTSQGPQGR